MNRGCVAISPDVEVEQSIRQHRESSCLKDYQGVVYDL